MFKMLMKQLHMWNSELFNLCYKYVLQTIWSHSGFLCWFSSVILKCWHMMSLLWGVNLIVFWIIWSVCLFFNCMQSTCSLHKELNSSILLRSTPVHECPFYRLSRKVHHFIFGFLWEPMHELLWCVIVICLFFSPNTNCKYQSNR